MSRGVNFQKKIHWATEMLFFFCFLLLFLHVFLLHVINLITKVYQAAKLIAQNTQLLKDDRRAAEIHISQTYFTSADFDNCVFSHVFILYCTSSLITKSILATLSSVYFFETCSKYQWKYTLFIAIIQSKSINSTVGCEEREKFYTENVRVILIMIETLDESFILRSQKIIIQALYL
jgi:hypothetical protein